ncbi:hypothetical protein [Paenibacillus sp. FSL K6-1318]|uniref:hypothetical protein n=1 Tax=Paenibacillus sp. FSL K6-1318 TaxID=2975291 RepID=UPI0030EECA95
MIFDLYDGAISNKLYRKLLNFEKKGLLTLKFEENKIHINVINEMDKGSVKKIKNLKNILAKNYLFKGSPLFFFGINEIAEIDKKIEKIHFDELNFISSYLISRVETTKQFPFLAIPLSVIIPVLNVNDSINFMSSIWVVGIMYVILGFFTVKSVRRIGIDAGIIDRIKKNNKIQ